MRKRNDVGLTLTEMVIVLALLGVTITAVFTTVQVLSLSARSTTTNSTAANDLSFTMELLSKQIMGSRLLYASDQRIVLLASMDDGSYQVQSIYTTPSVDPSAAVGQLVWERWSSDASGTAPAGSTHTLWAMSENNTNLYTSPETPLFEFYKAASDSSLMATTPPDKSSSPDASVAAFVGTLPGGYSVTAIGRVRLRVSSRFTEGVRDNSRDIVLRIR